MEKLINPSLPLNVCRASAGTGKTFTLSAYYIALLLSGESFRSILAVTFTNAATEEMKARILGYLRGIADGKQQEFVQVVRGFMLRDNNIGNEILQHRASTAIHAILQDYENFCVSTIDTFLQQLIRGTAKALDRTADFALDLDTERVIRRAVDRLFSPTAQPQELVYLQTYIQDNLDSGDKWDVREHLIDIAMELYKEQVQAVTTDSGKRSESIFDEQRIQAYKNAVLADWQQRQALFISQVKQAEADLANGEAYMQGKKEQKVLANMLQTIEQLNGGKKMSSQDSFFRGGTDSERKAIADNSRVKALQDLCDDCREHYWKKVFTLEFLNDMTLLRTLKQAVDESLATTNTMLLSETAMTLAAALKPGDADFILEKAGIRYRHIMIDEFQDTSTLQWKVFLHLVKEVLAVEGQTVLIVGDIKQSIYRFRNGNWQLMQALGNTELVEQFNPLFPTLVKNQRSREQVVDFNLHIMQQVANMPSMQYLTQGDHPSPIGHAIYDEGFPEKALPKFFRDDKHQGGYVRCRVFPYFDNRADAKTEAEKDLVKSAVQQALWYDVCLTIETLLSEGAYASDILILAQKNKELSDWVIFCREQAQSFPLLARTPIVSRDSFVLESCPTILVLVEALRYIHTASPKALTFVNMYSDEPVNGLLENFDRNQPLYDQVQQLITLLFSKQGVYIRQDEAYINSFLDALRQFIAGEGSKPVSFLKYWDDDLHKSAISADSSIDAIRLMTIHSSKGLEGKTVIILNAAWKVTDEKGKLWVPGIEVKGSSLPLIPVSRKGLRRCGDKAEYNLADEEEKKAQRIDNYNLLYVALTRAADNLFVYALVHSSKNLTLSYADTVLEPVINYTQLLEPLEHALRNYPLTTTCDAENSYSGLFAEYIRGDKPFVRKRETTQTRSDDPFDFSDDTVIPAILSPSQPNIQFRQSQESMQYMLDDDDRQMAQVNFGLLCHDIFAHINTADEAQSVIRSYQTKGLIESDEQLQKINSLILSALNNPQMSQWFDASWQVQRERTLLTPSGQYRPDRVMIKNDHAIVLDYKFGVPKRQHLTQVAEYRRLLQSMGYTAEGWLWYAFTNTLQKVDQSNL